MQNMRTQVKMWIIYTKYNYFNNIQILILEKNVLRSVDTVLLHADIHYIVWEKVTRSRVQYFLVLKIEWFP